MSQLRSPHALCSSEILKKREELNNLFWKMNALLNKQIYEESQDVKISSLCLQTGERCIKVVWLVDFAIDHLHSHGFVFSR